MKYVSLLLHIYQPPIQFPHVMERIVNNCYRPLVKILRELPEVRVAININACLTEMLAEKYGDVVEDLKNLAREGKVEFTGSTKYHALMPFLTEEEAIRQLDKNAATNGKFFGDLYNPKVFFPPEMAFAPEIIPLLKKRGYGLVLFDDLDYASRYGEAPKNYLPTT